MRCVGHVRVEDYYDCVIGMHLRSCLLWIDGVFDGCCGDCAFWVFSLVGFEVSLDKT